MRERRHRHDINAGVRGIRAFDDGVGRDGVADRKSVGDHHHRALHQPMLAHQRRVMNQHADCVVNGVVRVRGHAVGFVSQPIKCALELFAIVGESLNRLDAHAEGHHREHRRMF